MTRDPIITRWIESGDRQPGLMAIKTGLHTELVVSEYSPRAQEALIAEMGRRDAQRLEIEALKRRPEVIEGEFSK